jgi:hypothetical protein
MRLRTLIAVLLTGCVGTVDSNALDGSVSTDAGRGFGGPPVAIAGSVLSSLCETAPGASVQVLDSADPPTVTDATGHFTLSAPSTSALLVTRPGAVPTLTFGHDFSTSATGVRAGSIPSDFSALFHSLASFELPVAVGTIVAGVLDQAPLPVAGATVTLLDLDGGLVPANTRLRYASYAGAVIAFTADGGTGNTGIAAFFQVPPGLYVVHVERAGYAFPDTLVPVRGGTVTADYLQGAGTGASTPLVFSGTVNGQAPFPMAPGVSMPLSGYTVTAELDDGTRVATTSDQTGTYTLQLPAIGHWFDLTATSPGYTPLRSDQRCSGLETSLRFNVGDLFNEDDSLSYFLGTTPRVVDAGVILASAVRGTTGLVGATFETSPQLPTPFYGVHAQVPASCALDVCPSGVGCPAGTRCEEGECRLGDTGPLCSSCDAGTCAAGYQPQGTLPLDGGPGVCSCMPVVGVCDLTAPACPTGTYCWTWLQELDGGSRQVGGSYCQPYQPRATSTVTVNNGVPQDGVFTNVPTGLYLLSGAYDGGALPTRRVRVSPGVETSAGVVLP